MIEGMTAIPLMLASGGVASCSIGKLIPGERSDLLAGANFFEQNAVSALPCTIKLLTCVLSAVLGSELSDSTVNSFGRAECSNFKK